MTKYLTVNEVSQYLKRSPGAVRNLVLRRQIPFRKPVGRLLFDLDEVDKWIAATGISFNEIDEIKAEKKNFED